MTKLKVRIEVKHNYFQNYSQSTCIFDMTKTSVKVQNDWHKRGNGLAHIRYALSTHFDSIGAHKREGLTKLKQVKGLGHFLIQTFFLFCLFANI